MRLSTASIFFALVACAAVGPSAARVHDEQEPLAFLQQRRMQQMPEMEDPVERLTRKSKSGKTKDAAGVSLPPEMSAFTKALSSGNDAALNAVIGQYQGVGEGGEDLHIKGSGDDAVYDLTSDGRPAKMDMKPTTETGTATKVSPPSSASSPDEQTDAKASAVSSDLSDDELSKFGIKRADVGKILQPPKKTKKVTPPATPSEKTSSTMSSGKTQGSAKLPPPSEPSTPAKEQANAAVEEAPLVGEGSTGGSSSSAASMLAEMRQRLRSVEGIADTLGERLAQEEAKEAATEAQAKDKENEKALFDRLSQKLVSSQKEDIASKLNAAMADKAKEEAKSDLSLKEVKEELQKALKDKVGLVAQVQDLQLGKQKAEAALKKEQEAFKQEEAALKQEEGALKDARASEQRREAKVNAAVKAFQSAADLQAATATTIDSTESVFEKIAPSEPKKQVAEAQPQKEEASTTSTTAKAAATKSMATAAQNVAQQAAPAAKARARKHIEVAPVPHSNIGKKTQGTRRDRTKKMIMKKAVNTHKGKSQTRARRVETSSAQKVDEEEDTQEDEEDDGRSRDADEDDDEDDDSDEEDAAHREALREEAATESHHGRAAENTDEDDDTQQE